MKAKKASVILMCSLILLLLGVGCAGGNDASSEQGTTGQESTLNTIVREGVVRVGILPDFIPWSSLNTSGGFEGYDVDIAIELGEALGVKTELIAVDAPNRVASLVSGKVDVVIACITPTNERAKSIAFSIPYASEGQMAMVKKDSGLKTFDQLKGKKIALVRGGTPDLNATPLFTDSTILRFDSIADAYMAFKSDKADVLIENNNFIYSEIKKSPELYMVCGEPFSKGLISIAVKQGEQVWLNYINNFVTNIRFDGTNSELFEKWFKTRPASLEL